MSTASSLRRVSGFLSIQRPYSVISAGVRVSLRAAQSPVPTWQRASTHETRISTARYSTTAKDDRDPPPAEEDSENFWKVAADDAAFWDAYVATRPNYSRSFYDEIYAHHATHSASWGLAHDVGCGAGQVAAELASRFRHVVASDANDTHLTVAQRRLAPTLPAARVAYTHTMGEHLAAHHPAGSADLVAAAEAMVLMEERAALASFAALLRPGGTLALWFYGRPTFAQAALRARAQPLVDAVMVREWARVIRGSGARRAAGFKRAADGMASWLDYVPLDPATWIDVRRVKWNTFGTLPFFGAEACGFAVDAVSNVREGEKTEVREDPGWWRNDWDVAELKRYFSVLFPGFREAGVDEEVERMFEQLRDEMGGEGVVRQFTWPAVLVLATKK